MGNDDLKAASALQKFENLATRLFSIAKEDVAKVEEIAEEAAEEIIHPSPATDVD